MIYVFYISFFLSIVFNIALIFYCLKFARLLLSAQDAIEECLEVLETRKNSISKVLEIPLFFDSPEIRRVHDDLRASKDAILRVAETISTVTVEEEIENDDR
jgi:hypothetical protein